MNSKRWFSKMFDEIVEHPLVRPHAEAVLRALTKLARPGHACKETREVIAELSHTKLYQVIDALKFWESLGVIEIVPDRWSPSRRRIELLFLRDEEWKFEPCEERTHKRSCAAPVSASAAPLSASAAPLSASAAPLSASAAPPDARPIKDPAREDSLSREERVFQESDRENQGPHRQRSNPEPTRVGDAVPIGGALGDLMRKLPAAPVGPPPVEVDDGVKAPQPPPKEFDPRDIPNPPPLPPKKPDCPKGQSLTPSQAQFLSMLTADERAAWDALRPEAREMYLAWFSVDVSKGMLKEVMPKLRPREGPPTLPADDGTRPLRDFVEVLPARLGQVHVRTVTDILIRDLGDGVHSFPFWEGVLQLIAVGDLPSSVVLSPYEAVARMLASGKEIQSIPAYVTEGVKREIARHYAGSNNREASAQKTDRRVSRQSDPDGRPQIGTSMRQGGV